MIVALILTHLGIGLGLYLIGLDRGLSKGFDEGVSAQVAVQKRIASLQLAEQAHFKSILWTNKLYLVKGGKC